MPNPTPPRDRFFFLSPRWELDKGGGELTKSASKEVGPPLRSSRICRLFADRHCQREMASCQGSSPTEVVTCIFIVPYLLAQKTLPGKLPRGLADRSCRPLRSCQESLSDRIRQMTTSWGGGVRWAESARSHPPSPTAGQPRPSMCSTPLTGLLLVATPAKVKRDCGVCMRGLISFLGFTITPPPRPGFFFWPPLRLFFRYFLLGFIIVANVGW